MENEKKSKQQLVKELKELKDRVAELEAEEAKHKRVEKTLELKKRELETFINNIPHMAWLKDFDSNFILANKTFGDAVGMDPEYLRNHTCAICFGEEAAKKFKEDDKKVIQAKKQITLEETVLDKDGKKVFLETTKSPIYDEAGKVIGTVGIAIDITERKRIEDALSKHHKKLEDIVEKRTSKLEQEINERQKTEKELKKRNELLHNILNNSSGYAIVTTDLDMRITAYNNIAEKFFGYTSKNVIGKTVFEMHLKENVAQARLEKAINSVKETGEYNYFITQNINDGIRILSSRVTPMLDNNGQQIGFVLFSQDITEKKLAEDKINKLSTAVDQSPSVIVITKLDGDIEYANPKFSEITGYAEEEVIGENPRLLKSGEQPDEFYQELWETISSGNEWRGVFSNRKKNGGIFWESAVISPIKNKDGNPTHYIKVAEDITERRLAEEKLRLSEEKYRLITENVDDLIAICTFDLKAKYTYISSSHKRKLGYEKEDLLGKSGFAFMHPKDKTKLLVLMKKYLGMKINKILNFPNPGFTEQIEFRIRDNYNNWHYIESIAKLLENDRILFVSRDITERKKMEAKLRQSQQFLEDVFHSIQDGLSVLSPDLSIVHVNNVMKKWYKENLPLVGKKCYMAYHNQNRQCSSCPTTRCFETGKTERKIVRGLPGSPVEWIELFSYPMKDSETGRISGVVEFVRNITEQKRAEYARLETEKKYRDIFENLNDGMIYLSYTGKILDINKKAEEIYGEKKERIIGKKFTNINIIPKQKITKYLKAFKKALVSEKFSMDFQFINKKGKEIYLECSVTRMMQDGETNRLVVIARDVTERKKVTEALIESEEKFSAISNTASDAIILMDNNGDISYWNNAAERMFGYSSKEVQGKELHTFIAPDEFHDKFRTGFGKFKKNGKGATIGRILEFEAIKKNGTKFPIEVSTSALKIGEKWNSVGIIRDITERKEYEQQLKKSLEEKEVLIKEIHHRVKNNLNVVISLLNSQARRITDKQAIEAFKDSVNRIYTMALVHQQLYQSKSLASINMKEFIKTMANRTFVSYRINPKVSLILEIEKITFTIDTAVPLGLLISEAISNSLKYAFPDDRDGSVRITMKNKKKSGTELIIEDDGIGLPSEIDFEKTESLGLYLIKILIDQIGGTFKLTTNKGTKYLINFKAKDSYKTR